MKKMITILLTLALLCVFALPAVAEGGGTLTISGNATVSLAADTATLWIGARTSAESAMEAQKANAEIMTRVIEALITGGVSKEDIITSNFNIYLENIQNTGTDTANTPVMYTVSNTVFVTIRNLESIGNIIDAATIAGANDVNGLSFQSSKAPEAYESALNLAVKDAQKKAGILAASTGKVLGEITKVLSANSYGGTYGILNNYDMMEASAKGAVIVSGDVSVSAEVTLEYHID
jgi:uncharacterized protein